MLPHQVWHDRKLQTLQPSNPPILPSFNPLQVPLEENSKKCYNSSMNSFFNEEYEMRKRFINSEFKAVLTNIIETIQRLFTKTSHKFLCHFELVSESHEVKIPHQLRDDIKGQIFQPFKPLTIRKAFAFTLAETLIVMGIIGVVAALTIPNLNS